MLPIMLVYAAQFVNGGEPTYHYRTTLSAIGGHANMSHIIPSRHSDSIRYVKACFKNDVLPL